MARSKKGYFSDVALPGQTPEDTIDIALALDMSGSISDTMGKEMLSEVRGIMEQFTDFRENEIQPERFIMFTDGYPWDSWGDPDYCDTVFVIHGSEDIRPPFGNYAYYDKAK
jgi:predicted metal-dependent peptidase